MPVIYGAPLPPGLDASTKGELQIRIDKLILDDEALNHNPLVQQSLQHLATRLTSGNDATSSEGITEGPNRFVVPVHHCAVSPQFWGETRPSAQCQPATPQQGRRGAITITYPVKLREEGFAKYLHNMTRSPQKGLRLEVFVPSSYSGRKAVAVGQCVLALDPLCAGEVIDGWFTVYHDRRRGSALGSGTGVVGAVHERRPAADKSNSRRSRSISSNEGSSAGAAKDHATAAAIDGEQRQAEVAGPSSAGPSGGGEAAEVALGVLPTLIAIGKMKLRIQLSYFTRAAAVAAAGRTRHGSHARRRSTASAVSPGKSTASTSKAAAAEAQSDRSVAAPAASPQKEKRTESEGNGSASTSGGGNVPDRDGVGSQDEAVAAAATSAPATTVGKHASEELAAGPSTGAETRKVTAAPYAVGEAGLRDGVQPHHVSALDELMRRSLQLRDRIADAVAVAGGVPVLTTSPQQLLPLHSSHAVDDDDHVAAFPLRDELHRLPLHARRYHDEAPFVAVPASHSPRSAALVLSDGDTEDETVYTSECSDAEARSLARQHMGSPPTRGTAGGTSARSDPSPGRHESCAAVQKRRRKLHSSRSSATRSKTPPPRTASAATQAELDCEEDEEEEEVEEFAAAVAAQGTGGAAALQAPRMPPHPFASVGSATVVELVFSDIAFATNAMTAALTAMRLNVRLSADITTGAPNTGPFSSYVHPVPLRQSAICLSFAIRTYSEQTSRLVIECLKVTTPSSSPRAAVEEEGALPLQAKTTDAGETTEELLGLCIVGLYAQSRAIVLRDPVSNLNNVLGRLTVQLVGSDASSKASVAGAAATPHVTSLAAAGTPHEVQRSLPARRASPAAERDKENDRTRLSRTPCATPTRKRTPSHHTVVEQREDGLRRRTSSPYRTLHTLRDASTTTGAARSDGEPGRFRLRVAIRSAKEVPLVALREAFAHRTAHLAALLDRRHFAAPSTFFVVEDVYSGVDGHVASTGPVSAWYVEQVQGGHYDRTHVVPSSQRPEYNYRCTLSLPHESVYLKQRLSQSSSSDACAAKACLRELRLTLWHYAQADQGTLRSGAVQEEDEDGETLFWSQAAYMGEARIDLRPLRYLSHLDGYYRVVATASGAAAGGSEAGAAAGEVRGIDEACGPLCAVSGQTVGYVHVCVSLCHGDERDDGGSKVDGEGSN